MDDFEELRQKILDVLGEHENPLIVERILKKSVPNIFWWILQDIENILPMVRESAHIAERCPDEKLSMCPLPTGIRMLEGHLKRILFIFSEVTSRMNAIE